VLLRLISGSGGVRLTRKGIENGGRKNLETLTEAIVAIVPILLILKVMDKF
jgi:hypothetical protein